MGIALVVALVVGGISAAFKKSFRTPLFICYGILVLPLALLFASSMGSLARGHRIAREVSEARKEQESHGAPVAGAESGVQARAEMPTSSDTPERILSDTERKKEAQEELERLRLLALEFSRELEAVRKDLFGLVRKEDMTDLLSLERIAKDRGLHESNAKVAKIRKSIDDSRARALRILQDLPERFEKHSIKEPFKHPLTRKVSMSVEATVPLYLEFWDLEVKSFNHVVEALQHLDATRENWGDSGSGFQFTRDGDLERFIDMVGETKRCSTRQQKIREELAEILPEDSEKAPSGTKR